MLGVVFVVITAAAAAAQSAGSSSLIFKEVGEQRTMRPARVKPWGVLKVISQLSLSTQTAQPEPVMVP